MAIGALPPRLLAAWLAVATLFVAFIAVHEVGRGAVILHQASDGSRSPVPFPAQGSALAAAALALFIAQALVIGGQSDRRLIAAYPTYFAVAWKQEVQLLLSLFFLGVLWALLRLGAELFALIDIVFLRKLIARAAFAIP